MTNQEIRNISEDLYNKLGLTDYMRLCRMMEHKVNVIYAPDDHYEPHMYEYIMKEMGMKECEENA